MPPRFRGTPALGSVLAHHAGTQQSAILEMVCRRQNQRLLQLRRPTSRAIQKQSGADFCSGAGRRSRHGHHLPGTLPPGDETGPPPPHIFPPPPHRPPPPPPDPQSPPPHTPPCPPPPP